MESPIPNNEVELKRESLSKFLGARGVTEIELLEPEILTRNSIDLIKNIDLLKDWNVTNDPDFQNNDIDSRSKLEALEFRLKSIKNNDTEKSRLNLLVKAKRAEVIQKETEKILGDLNLSPETEIQIEKRTIRFREDVSRGMMAETFPDRQQKQEITLYLYKPKIIDEANGVTVAILSHGGTIVDDDSKGGASMQSNFHTMIHNMAEAKGVPLLLGAFNHRGSNLDSQTKYTLYDRCTDIAVVQMAMLGQGILDQERTKKLKIALIGNSMGGAVASLVAPDLMPDELILPQPSAYAKDSEFAPLGPKFKAAISSPNNDSWFSSRSFYAVGQYLERGGKVLVIGAKADDVIPEGVIASYEKELVYREHVAKTYLPDVTHQYTRTAQKPVGLMWIDVDHHSTTKGELEAIVEQCKIKK